MTLSFPITNMSSALRMLTYAALYVAMAWLGRNYASYDHVVGTFWLPAALTSYGAWRHGHSVVIATVLGQFAVSELTGHDPAAMAILFSAGNGLTSWLMARQLHQHSDTAAMFSNSREAIRWIRIIVVTQLVSAAFGVMGLLMAGFLPTSEIPRALWNWWSGNVGAILMLMPLMMALRLRVAGNPLPALSLRRWPIYGSLVLLLLISVLIFGNNRASMPQSIVFLMMPPTIWLALNAGVSFSTMALFIAMAIATVSTVSGLGPYAGQDIALSLLQLQLFSIVFCITHWLLLATNRERHELYQNLQAKADELDKRVIERTINSPHSIMIWSSAIPSCRHSMKKKICCSRWWRTI